MLTKVSRISLSTDRSFWTAMNHCQRCFLQLASSRKHQNLIQRAMSLLRQCLVAASLVGLSVTGMWVLLSPTAQRYLLPQPKKHHLPECRPRRSVLHLRQRRADSVSPRYSVLAMTKAPACLSSRRERLLSIQRTIQEAHTRF